jgi:cytochrome c peroxidase
MKHPMELAARYWKLIGVVAICLLVLAVGGYSLWPRTPWTKDEMETIRGLWIGSLEKLPPDPSNVYGDVPAAAILGHKLFFDTRFSSNEKVACGTCHLPERLFQDGRPLANGIGTTTRRTMTIIGTAYSSWLFWDGRKDSQWAQALGPMENPVEHGGNRTQYAHLIAQYYRPEYEALFGLLPDLSGLPASAGPVPDQQARAAWEAMTPQQRDAVSRVYANMGKAIAAYERLLLPGPARFDRYAEAILQGENRVAQQTMTGQEIAGLKLFIGKANCVQCHNGPLFTDNHFHNTGVPEVTDLPEDLGRASGARQVQTDEFNCLSLYSDAEAEACSELRYMIAEGDELVRQFKPPSLRDVAERAPYMHAGQFATLEEVLAHYNTAPDAPAGHSELKALHLTADELSQLIAFLHTLSGPLATSQEWLVPPAGLQGAQ